jgi:hypothetical protein
VVKLPVAVPANLLRDGVSAAGVGGALLRVGRWNMRFCSGVWRCSQAHAGSPSPLALVREAIPRRRPARCDRATFAALLSMLRACRDAHHSRRYRRG